MKIDDENCCIIYRKLPFSFSNLIFGPFYWTFWRFKDVLAILKLFPVFRVFSISYLVFGIFRMKAFSYFFIIIQFRNYKILVLIFYINFGFYHHIYVLLWACWPMGNISSPCFGPMNWQIVLRVSSHNKVMCPMILWFKIPWHGLGKCPKSLMLQCYYFQWNAVLTYRGDCWSIL